MSMLKVFAQANAKTQCEQNPHSPRISLCEDPHKYRKQCPGRMYNSLWSWWDSAEYLYSNIWTRSAELSVQLNPPSTSWCYFCPKYCHCCAASVLSLSVDRQCQQWGCFPLKAPQNSFCLLLLSSKNGPYNKRKGMMADTVAPGWLCAPEPLNSTKLPARLFSGALPQVQQLKL